MTNPTIRLRDVRAHNRDGVDVEVPRGRLTVVTGVSGSGKSSLVFDTLHAASERRYLETLSSLLRVPKALEYFMDYLITEDAEKHKQTFLQASHVNALKSTGLTHTLAVSTKMNTDGSKHGTTF